MPLIDLALKAFEAGILILTTDDWQTQVCSASQHNEADKLAECQAALVL